MTDNLIQALQDWGMSHKESKIYLTLLELWSAPASTVGRRAGIKRVTSYAILKDLERRGIASSLDKSGVLHFQVLNPKKLSLSLKNKADRFDAFVPELLAMADVYGNKPRIKYFEWIDWIKSMYDDLLISQTEILAFLGYTDSHPAVHDYLLESFLPERIAKNIHARVILSPSSENEYYVWLDDTHLKESIMIEHDVFKIPSSEINIYGPNKVMFAMFKGEELSWLIIESETMYQSFKSIFELLRLTHKK